MKLLEHSWKQDVDLGCCSGCHLMLKDPFIQCNECEQGTMDLCLECFSKGKEVGSHKNSHDYVIIRHSYPLFCQDWSANEEMTLLNMVSQYGYGNWLEVSKFLPEKSADDCRRHFDNFYIEKNSSLDMPEMYLSRRDEVAVGRGASVVYLGPTIDPPRPSYDSAFHKHLVGYNAARSDFDVEYLQRAEEDLNYVDVDDPIDLLDGDEEAFLGQVELTLVDIYNRRLKERAKRKRLIREYGLLCKSKLVNQQSRYSSMDTVNLKYEGMFRFSKLMCSFDFDYLMEGLLYRHDICSAIRRLQHYRRNGLTGMVGTGVFLKLRQQRERSNAEVPDGTVEDWVHNRSHIRHIKDGLGGLVPTILRRKAAPRLDVVGLPAFERLDRAEQKLCSQIRLVPETYLSIKQTLALECKKNDGVKLADARNLLKIDVTKTRKVYDFLIEQGIIHKAA